ncbi:HEPN domain-containing protein [Mucilaginibacter sp.]
MTKQKNVPAAPLEPYRHLVAGQSALPLLTLKEFFADDGLHGHLNELRRWRRFILGPNGLDLQKENPANLWFTCKQNCGLVLAAQLLLDRQQNQDNIYYLSPVSEEEIEMERQCYPQYPTGLSLIEQCDPYIVLTGFFMHQERSGWLDQLNEWLGDALSTALSFEYPEPLPFVESYEWLQRLYAACFLIHIRLPQPVSERDNPKDMLALQEDLSEYSGPISLNTHISEARQEQLTAVTGIIRKKLPTALAVLYLGAASGEPDLLFLLVIVSKAEKMQGHEVAGLLEDRCHNVAPLAVLIYAEDNLVRSLNGGSYFFSRALRECQLIYLSESLLLPAIPLPDEVASLQRRHENFVRWYGQGSQFLEGARFYYAKAHYGMCLFMLHQAVEGTLMAVIRGVTGYRLSVHNLTRMLKLTRMFTDDILKLFRLNTNKGAELFLLLKDAYSQSRYKDDYMPDAENVRQLMIMVEECVTLCKQVYERHLQRPGAE